MFNRKLSRGVSKIQAGAMLAMAVLGVTSLAPRAQAANVVLNDTNLTLSDPNAWVGLVAPTASDIAVFGSSLSGSTNSLMTWAVGTGANWLGVQVLNPGGNVIISDTANALILGSSGLTLSTVNPLANTLTLNTLLTMSTAQTWTVGVGSVLNVNGNVNAVSQNLTINSDGDTNISSSIQGAGASLTKSGIGVLTLTTQSSYTGLTTVNRGVLTLDFTSGAVTSNLLNSSGTLVLGGNQIININGGAAVSDSQTFAATQFTGISGTTLNLTAGIGGTLTLGMGNLRRDGVGQVMVLNISDPDNTTVTAAVSTGVTTGTGGMIVGTGAQNQSPFMLYGTSDVAALSGGLVVPGSSLTNFYSTATWATGTNWDVTANVTANGGTAGVGIIRFNTPGATTVNYTGTDKTLGGVLITPNMGAANVSLQGGTAANNTMYGGRNNDSREIIFWQNNTSGLFNLSVQMRNPRAGALASNVGSYTYAGPGTSYLFGAATNSDYYGRTTIIGSTVVTSANGAFGVGTAPLFLSGGTWLGSGSSFTSARSITLQPTGGGLGALTGGNLTVGGQISGSGTLTIGMGTLTGTGADTANTTAVIGRGTVTISGVANTYSAGTFVNNGVLNVSALTGTPLGSGSVVVNPSGTITATGVLPGLTSVDLKGTLLVSTSGTINSTITFQSGSAITGAGTVSTITSLPTGASIEPGSRTTVSTLGFQSLTLQSGSILNMNLVVAGTDDLVNISNGGTLNLGSGIVVNMFYTAGDSFFSNGSYQLITGVDVINAGHYSGGVTSGILSNFTTGNLDTSGSAAAVFSIVPNGTLSNIWVTITGARTVTHWTGTGGSDWLNSGSWTAGVPGGLAGDTALFDPTVAITPVAVNGNQHLGLLAVDAGTNSGWAIGAGSGKLFLDSGTNSAALTVGRGVNSIASLIEIDSSTLVQLNSSAGSMTISGVINAPSTASIVTISGTGAAALILTADNSIAARGTVQSTARLQFGDNTATGSWGSGTVTATGIVIAKRTGVFNYTSLAGLITGAGTVTNAGTAGNMIWDSTLTTGGFTGTVLASGGTLTPADISVTNRNTFATSAGAVLDLSSSSHIFTTINNAGTMLLGGNNVTVGTLNSAGLIDNNSATPVALAITSNGTISGLITQSGGGTINVFKTGGGVLTMNGTSSYSGSLTISGGAVLVGSNTAIPVGSIVTLLNSNGGTGVSANAGLNLSPGVNIGAQIHYEAGSFEAMDIASSGNATLSGSYIIDPVASSQLRLGLTGNGTLTITGGVEGTTGGLMFFTQGNFVFDGPSATFTANNTGGTGVATINIGRSSAGSPASRNTNVTLKNGASWVDNATVGIGVSLGAGGQTNGVQTLTVDHSSILLGALTFELGGQSTASNLNVIGGTIVTGGFLKTNTNSLSTVTLNGALLVAGQTNSNFIPGANNLSVILGTGGVMIDTTALAYSLGLSSPFRTNTTGADGGLTLLGTGSLTFNATNQNYNGDTTIATGTLYAGTDNTFSPNSVLKVYNTGSVVAQGTSQIIGGLDDQASATKTSATGFSGLTINLSPGKIYQFDGTMTADSLTVGGAGTQTLTGAASVWTTNTTIGTGGTGAKLVVGSAGTNGLNVSTSGSLTLGAGENTLEWILGTGGSAGFTANSLGARQSGSAANLVVTDGINGTTNFIKISTAPVGFIDQGTFFNGADYAYVDAGTFVRAPQYGTDALFSAANDLSILGNHVSVSGSVNLSAPSNFKTIQITGIGVLNQTGNAMTLDNAGILKSGGGDGSISGGNITGAFGTELIIRVNSTLDTLTIASNILDSASTNGGTLLTKSSTGSLILSGVNTFSGKLNVLNGAVVVANASALQNTLINLGATSNIKFAAGTTTAAIGSVVSTAGANGTLTLQDLALNPVNLIINISNSPTLPLSGDGFTRINIMNGLIAGTGSVTFQSSNTDGRYDFNGSSTYAGGTTILSGRVQANQQALGANSLDSSFGTGPITLTGGTLASHGSGVAVAFNNAFIFNGVADFNTPANATINGNISGGGTVTRGGGSTLLFNGSDNAGFTGTFINNAGDVTFGNAATSGAVTGIPGASAWIFNNAATFTIFDTLSGAINLTQLQGTVSGVSFRVTMNDTTVTNTVALNIGAANVDNTFVGAITTTASNNEFVSLTKVGTGNLSLGGVSNFSGNVTLAGGTLTSTLLDGGVIAATNASASAGSTSLVVVSATGLLSNMIVSGPGIKPGTTISGINGTTITLSTPTTAIIASGTSSGFSFMGENRAALGVGGTLSMAANTTFNFAGSTATASSTSKFLVVGGNVTFTGSGATGVNFSNPASISFSSAGSFLFTFNGSSSAANNMRGQIVNNGASATSVAFNGTGLWTLSGTANTYTGGTTVSGGELMIVNTTGNSLGSGTVLVNGGGTLAGSGYATAPITIGSTGHLGGGGVSLTNHLGTINLLGAVTLNTGAVLDFDMSLPGSPNDIINLASTGTLILPAVANSVAVNLYDSNATTNYFYNGTYNLFTNILPSNTTSILANLGSLHVANEPVGPTFGLSLASDTVSTYRLIVTIAGAWSNANWTNASSDNLWTTSANWIGGIPNGSGHIANFASQITASTNITMIGSKTLTNLAFNSTYSMTISPQTVTDTLVFVGGSANGSLITMAAAETQSILTPIAINGSILTISEAANDTLTLAKIGGAGSLVLTSAANSSSVIITGVDSHTGGTQINNNATLVVGNGSTGTLAGGIGLIDLVAGGRLIFNHTDNVNFAASSLVQTDTGTVTNTGSGILNLNGTLPFFGATGSQYMIPGAIVVTAGKVTVDTDWMLNGSAGNVTTAAAGTFDLLGHAEGMNVLTNNGTLTSSVGTTGVLTLLSATGVSTNAGVITGNLNLVKDGAGTLTFNNGGTVNNSTITIVNGQVIYASTTADQLSNKIVMAQTSTTAPALVLGANASLSTDIFLSGYNFVPNPSTVEFIGTQAGVNATFAGDVTMDTANFFFYQLRLGNTTTGTLTFSGNMTVPATGILGMVSRGTVILGGSGVINSLNTTDNFANAGNTFTIGNLGDSNGASVNFIQNGSSQLLTSVPDSTAYAVGQYYDNQSIGIRLGNTAATSGTFTHTVAGDSYLRVGIGGASAYDVNPMSTNRTTTLTLSGGSIQLSRFMMSGTPNVGGGGGSFYPQANIILNGGTVMAGLANNDLTPGANGPFNMKMSVSTGGLILDLNGKQGVAWTQPLSSAAAAATTAAAFTDGGVSYVSRSAPSTITLSTRQLYAGKTTIGQGATVIVANSDMLGNPAAAAPVNFAGGVMRLSQSFTLASTDSGSTYLTHQFSFNEASAGGILDSVTANPFGGILNNNATQNGSGVLSMTNGANSQVSSLLQVSDIGGPNTAYTSSGVSFAIWYTPNAYVGTTQLFSIGANSTFGQQFSTANTASNYFGVTANTLRAYMNVGGGELVDTIAQPATGVEHLLVVTIDNGNMAIFMDGVLANRIPLTTLGGGTLLQNLQNGAGIMLGGSQTSSEASFNGSFDEFRIYNSVLNPNFIASMTASSPTTLSGVVAMNRDITVATTGGTLDLNGFVLNVGGNMSGAGTLSLGSGSLILTGASTTNLVNPTGTKLFVGAGGNGGALTSGNVTNGDNIVFNRNDSAAVMGATVTGGTVTFAGTGTTTITAATLPKLVLSAGALSMPASVSVSNGLTISGGTGLGFKLGATPDTLSITGAYSYTGGGNINILTPQIGVGFDVGSYTVISGAGTSLSTYSAPADSNGFHYEVDATTVGSLKVVVSANWFANLFWRSSAANTLWTNNNNWSDVSALSTNASGSPLGPTTVIFNTTNSAAVNLVSPSLANALSFTGTGVTTVAGTTSGASLMLLGSNAITVGAGAANVNVNAVGGLNLNAVSSNITNNGTSGLTIAAAILGASLTLAGAGLTTLSTANTFSTGVSIAAGGNVRILNGGALGNKALNVDGALELNAQTVSVTSLTGASTGVITGTPATLASLTTTVASTSTVTYAGHIVGNVGLTKAGGGTLVLSGSSSFVGGTSLSAGQILLGGNALSPNSSLTIAAVGSLDMAGFSSTSGGLSGSVGALITNSAASLSTLTVNSSTGASTTYSGTIENGAGTVALVKTGPGTLALGSGNSFTGGVTLLDGTLSATTPVAGSTATSLGTGLLTLTGGTFRMQPSGNVDSVLANDILFNGNSQFNTSGGANATLSGNISGSGIMVKSGGSGSINVTGTDNSSFHGTIFYDNSTNGTLGNISFINPGAFPASDFNLTLNAPTTATFNATANVSVGIATLSGNNASGVVALVSGNTNGITTTLTVGATPSSTFAGVISSDSTNTMSLVKVGTGTLVLSNNITISGGVTISNGALQLGNNGASGSLAVSSVVDDSLLIFNRTNTTTPGFAISGTGAVTQAGSGTLLLNGTNSYQGGTNFNAGTTSLASTQPLGIVGLLSFNGGTLQFTTVNTTDYSARFSGAASQQFKLDTNGTVLTLGTGIGNSQSTSSLTKLGLGTLILTAANSYGATTISGGTLRVGNATATGSLGSGNVVDNGLLEFNRSNALSVAGAITGTGSVTQSGAGTTTLAQNMSVGGMLTISSGQLAVTSDGGSHGSPAIIAGGLTISGGSLDMKDRDGIIRNVTDVVTFGNMVVSGQITSSTATPGSGGQTVGYGLASQIGGIGAPGITSYEGKAVGPNDMILQYTAPGDVTLDGSSDSFDLLAILNNFGNLYDGPTWWMGDVTGDGSVDSFDLLAVLNDFGNLVGGGFTPLNTVGSADVAPSAPSSSAVPEPASLAVLALGAVGLLTRRKRK